MEFGKGAKFRSEGKEYDTFEDMFKGTFGVADEELDDLRLLERFKEDPIKHAMIQAAIKAGDRSFIEKLKKGEK